MFDVKEDKYRSGLRVCKKTRGYFPSYAPKPDEPEANEVSPAEEKTCSYEQGGAPPLSPRGTSFGAYIPRAHRRHVILAVFVRTHARLCAIEKAVPASLVMPGTAHAW